MSSALQAPRLFGVILATTLLSACGAQSQAASAAAPAAAGPPPAVVTGAPLVRGLPDFANLVEAVGPAVVNVTVIEKRQRPQALRGNPLGGGGGGGDDDDPFSDFFRQFQGQPRDNTPEEGVGSGFIVSSDGYILTNTHVVDNATRVIVKLTDRREFQAKVVGSDDKSDVALLKIDAKNLPTARIGDVSKLRPGEWVVAIGSPFNFQNSVTAGIVSAIGREVPNASNYNYVNFIQTDVAVNPGNSGGPLFNMNGEVVGINSQIYSNTGSYAGLSFAIPIDIAQGVREQLAATGHVTRGRIGVAIQPVTAALAESFGLDRPRGAAVSSVDSGGPADKAGLKPEDVILSVNGRRIERSSEVPSLIAAVRPGTAADLEIWRGKGTRHISVVVEELKDKAGVAKAKGSGTSSDKLEKLGLSVRELTAQEKTQLKTNGSVVITEVDGPAAEAGLRAGDVILGANRTRISSLAELREAVKDSVRAVAMLIQSNNQQRIVTIQLD
jgi:serine protease Do